MNNMFDRTKDSFWFDVIFLCLNTVGIVLGLDQKTGSTIILCGLGLAYFLLKLSIRYYIIKRVKNDAISLSDDVWYQVSKVTWPIMDARLVSDENGHLKMEGIESEFVTYRYDKAVVHGDFHTPGLLRKKTVDGEIHLYPDRFPSVDMGGGLLIWE